jgi:hypothetical protein
LAQIANVKSSTANHNQTSIKLTSNKLTNKHRASIKQAQTLPDQAQMLTDCHKISTRQALVIS